jgi:hypothetical protein
VSLVKRRLGEINKGEPGGAFLDMQDIAGKADALHFLIKRDMPHAVCRLCGGRKGGCDACDKQGWLPKRALRGDDAEGTEGPAAAVGPEGGRVMAAAALDEFTLFDLASLPPASEVAAADDDGNDAPAVPVLRPYQQEAVAAAVESFRSHVSTLIAMATGCGKTIVFSHLIEAMGARRTMILAHREELIDQAVAKVEQVTGRRPAVEKGESWADCGVRGRRPVVVSSIQTQLAKSARRRASRGCTASTRPSSTC